MTPLRVWNPTLCTLQLVFSRPGGSSAPIQAGSPYQGTSVIRYRLQSLTEEEEAGVNSVASGNDVSSSSFSEYEEFLQHRRVVAAKHALHLHALTTAGGLYQDASPLQVMSYQVQCVSSSPSGGGKGGVLKVLAVEQMDAGAAASTSNNGNGDAVPDKKQKKKGNMNNKSSTAASNAAVENASVDWGSKLVLFERCDTLPLHSEVELTVQFTGTVQAFDHGGIYAARTEGTSNSAEDRALLTHLEVRFARCAFPCPDDPQYRLDWQLKSVQLPDSYTAVLTNGEEQGRRALTAQRAVQRSFAPCGPLPAYSFSFACFPEPLEEVASTMAIPEFAGGIAEGLQSHAGTIPCATIPVRVLARRQARIPAATLERVLHITKEAVATLQQRFDCPLPLLQCRHLDVLLGPTMPFISGMEHHCCIILNETMYQSGKKASGGGGSAEAEQTELIIHELAHHWMGNALGLPFPVKEGVCQVLEQCIGDTLLGKPMRKFKPDSAAVAPAGATGNQDAAVSTKTNPISQMIQAAEKGHEFTGSSYQQALKAIRHFVADRGFAVFERSLRHIVHAQVLLPTIAVEEQGGTQMLRCVGGDVPPPPYLSTEAFLRSMKLLSS